MHVAPTVTAGASVDLIWRRRRCCPRQRLSVSDVDSGGNLAGATVSIGTGFV